VTLYYSTAFLLTSGRRGASIGSGSENMAPRIGMSTNPGFWLGFSLFPTSHFLLPTSYFLFLLPLSSLLVLFLLLLLLLLHLLHLLIAAGF
jgi:hypothetical protein